MGVTPFPNGITSYGIPVFGGGVMSQGQAWFVKPRTGNNANNGKSSDKAFKTLDKAQTMAVANRNDVVYLFAESNTAADTTDYQSATLAWAKDLVHLVGVGAPVNVSNRARVAFLSTYDTASNLFTLSASGCIISNISLFAGVAGTLPTGCMNVTGSRNFVSNCHIAGIGHANNDINSAYSLQISAGQENLFSHCTIGVDTIARGTGANSELRLVSAATRNKFENCDFTTYAEAAGHQFLIVGASGLDRYTKFENCNFINMPTGIASGTTMTEAFDVGATPGGLLLLKNCTMVGCDDWEANVESAITFIDGGAPTNNTSGLAVLVEAT